MADTEIQCGVCNIHATAPRESIVYTDDSWTVTLGYDVPGWVLVMANRHTDDWLWGLSPHEASTMGSLIQRLSAAVHAEADVERVYMMAFGEQWRHVHFMLMSRSASIGADLRGAGMLALAPELADPDEALRVGARIRQRLISDAGWQASSVVSQRSHPIPDRSAR
jgi:diadenosine tetraphosphate (Ap4A) HIT family hydrolase